MKKRRSIFSPDPGDGINLTPLLDVIFNLVFFFLLATNVRQSQALLQVELPSAQSATETKPTEKNEVVIVVTAEDKISVDGTEYTDETLSKFLGDKSHKAKLEVMIRGDSLAHHATIVEVMDICSRVGITEVSVQVKKKKAE